jgi:hypothetical protein
VSKTQIAYEGALAGDPKAFDILVGMCASKCRNIWPPHSLDTGAETKKHAFHRHRTARYVWIQRWLFQYLKPRPRPANETGYGVVQRCQWRLLNAIERTDKANEPKTPKRIRRSDPRYPSKEFVADFLSTLPEIQDPILRDLWERILDAYPDYKCLTNEYLAVICGVHTNTLSSRRAALAVLQQREASESQIRLLEGCLRLKIGKTRKTDLHRVEAQTGGLTREAAAATRIQVGTTKLMDWHHGSTKGAASGDRVWIPVFDRLAGKTDLRHYRPPARCSFLFNDGRQCMNTAEKCPLHRPKPTI